MWRLGHQARPSTSYRQKSTGTIFCNNELNSLILIGESVLHITIVNEDPTMVKFLLDAGADYHERCYGNFMCPEDQKASRTDSFDHEYVNVQPDTNYSG